ncbi:hypothetical protein MAR_024810 [Mya arenaria]|uniref:Uncharacterized protein n=1 Tax=Mya arenaria TaxID=6604 RepID=A0ABY7DRW2_MYAAR|nr:hypothetical protein MAR_024810 [Mya arenaria]
MPSMPSLTHGHP